MGIFEGLLGFKMMNKKLYINQILKLPVSRIGNQGDMLFMYHNLIIIVRTEGKVEFNVNKFMEIRITKIMPKFAFAEIVKK